MKFIIAVHKHKETKKPMVFVTEEPCNTETCKDIFPDKVSGNWDLFELEADEAYIVKDEAQIRDLLIEETGDA